MAGSLPNPLAHGKIAPSWSPDLRRFTWFMHDERTLELGHRLLPAAWRTTTAKTHHIIHEENWFESPKVCLKSVCLAFFHINGKWLLRFKITHNPSMQLQTPPMPSLDGELGCVSLTRSLKCPAGQ